MLNRNLVTALLLISFAAPGVAKAQAKKDGDDLDVIELELDKSAPAKPKETPAAAAWSSAGWVAPVAVSTPPPPNESPPVSTPAAVPRAPISRKVPTPNASPSVAPKSSASEPSHCSPPYHFDAEGFRVYRKECL